MGREKLVPAKNMPFHRPKLIIEEIIGRSDKSYRELGRKIQVYHKTAKKYMTKKGVHRKAKKSAPNTRARKKFVIKAGLKLLMQCFSLKNRSTNGCRVLFHGFR
jgi:hypothetical protein